MKRFLFTLLLIASVLIPAISANATSSRWFTVLMGEGVVVAPCTPLGDIISSTVADLDATCNDSYSGSGQTWVNTETTPADSASQTDYDFFLGVDGSSSTDDPTFTGSAGDSGAFFALDGGDFFQIAGGNTTLLANAHRTDGAEKITVIIAFQSPGTWGNSNIYGTVPLSATGTHGYRMRISSSGSNLNIQQYDGTSRLGTTLTSGSFATSTDFIFALAFDYDGVNSGTVNWSINSTSFTVESSVTSQTDTSSATEAMQISSSAASQPLPNGSRIYGFYIFNEILSDASLDLVIARLCARHNRNYTGSCL